MPVDPMTIDADELRDLLDRHERVTILDVRPGDERTEWAIPGSIHADAYEALQVGAPDALAGVDLPADRPVVTVCGAGKTSLTAAERLRARGLAARSLKGGMKAWSLAWNVAEVAVPGTEATVVQVRRTGKGCLSYVVGSGGEAAAIDASLDPAVYLELAAERGWRIVHVLDTHVHADHLSRSRLLAERAGAALHLPGQDRVAYPFAPLADGHEVAVGESRLAVVATPGHTRESAGYLLDGRAVFTGDTLFLDGVGRPDLEADPIEARERARLLHRSLRRLLDLPPETVVLPGHTSAPVPFDGAPLAATLAEVAARLPMLDLDEDGFVTTLLERLPPSPSNHARIVELNEAGEFPAGDPTDLEAGANRCAIA